MKASGGLGERNPLALALLLSLLLHLFLFGGWRLGEQLGWWRQNPAWLQRLNPAKWLPKPVLKTAQSPPQRPREIPLTFLEVDPATAVAEPPPAAKFYGAQNARAANPDATVETHIPKVDGKQTQVARLETVPKPNPVPLQPSAPPATAQPVEQASAPPKKAEAPGDLAKAKPAERPPEVGSSETATIPRDRPRTLALELKDLERCDVMLRLEVRTAELRRYRSDSRR